MTEYTDFVASLSLEEQFKMPLTEAEIETYIGLIDQFLNYTACGLELLPLTFTNIKANALEFSSRIKATYEIEPSILNRAREKLTLAIPLMKTKHPEIAKLLAKNLEDTISFIKEHAPQMEFGLSTTVDPQSPNPIAEAIDESRRRVSEE